MATDPTLNSLQNSINSIRKDDEALLSRIKVIEDRLEVFATRSELLTEVNRINTSLEEFNCALIKVEERLKKIILPEETRFFLQESEITDFRNHFRQLRTFMAELERSRQAFIRLSARFNLTNSRL